MDFEQKNQTWYQAARDLKDWEGTEVVESDEDRRESNRNASLQ